MKSNVAMKVIKNINPDINIHTYIESVESKNEHIYNKFFFEELDGIVVALRDTEARKL